MANRQAIGEDASLPKFIEDTHKEYEQTQKELKEIDVLIKQNKARPKSNASPNAAPRSLTTCANWR
jgi:hypothetical protein